MRTGFMALGLALLLHGCASSEPANRGHGSVMGGMGEPVREVSGYGFITQIATGKPLINIKHGPIPELNWAPMVMDFNVAEDVDLTLFQRGQKVSFTLELDSGNNYRIKQIVPMAN